MVLRPSLGLARALGVLLISLGQVACFEIEPFECGSNEACERDGQEGRCEPEGVCAYRDEACTSGWRYSPNAGPLAEVCVDEAADAGGGPAGESSGEVLSCEGCQRVDVGARTFFVCPDASTWFDARDACVGCGLSLASLRTSEENAAVAARVPEGVQLWIGLTDREIEGTWVWQDGESPELMPWADGEPSALTEDDCGALVSSQAWFAKRCDLPNPYVCATPSG